MREKTKERGINYKVKIKELTAILRPKITKCAQKFTRANHVISKSSHVIYYSRCGSITMGALWSLIFGRSVTVNGESYKVLRRIGEGGKLPEPPYFLVSSLQDFPMLI